MSENTPSFIIDLGGGQFMDHEGNLVSGPAPYKPVYSLPGADLPVNPAAIKKTFSDISNILPTAENKKTRSILQKLGLPEDYIKLLGDIGEIAGTLAKIAGVASFAYDALKMLGLFKSGPDPVIKLLNERFDSLEDLERLGQLQEKFRYINDQRTVLEEAINQIDEYFELIRYRLPLHSEIARKREAMNQQVGDAQLAIRRLVKSETWRFAFNQNEYRAVWPWLWATPHTYPPNQSPKPAPMPPHNNGRFDHRLMIVHIPFAVTAYLNLIKAFIPEYRTTGNYDGFLREFAQSVDDLAIEMRSQTLARTVYEPWHFGSYLTKDQVNTGFLDLIPPTINPDQANWAVGALDLCLQTDTYLRYLQEQAQSPRPFTNWVGFPIPLHYHPTMNLRWVPPANLEEVHQLLGQDIVYKITNPEACAKAANALAEQHYANLLLSSGYFSLVQTAVLLRHLATEPDESETIKGEIYVRRQAQASHPVEVQSEDIPFSGVITAMARQEPQQNYATAEINTQPLESERSLLYRVVLRSLRSTTYRDVTYNEYYQTDYIDDTKNLGFKKLKINTRPSWKLDKDIVLYEGPSPEKSQEETIDKSIKASTFDWYIPVESSIYDEYQLQNNNYLVELKKSHYAQQIAQGLPNPEPQKDQKEILVQANNWRSPIVDVIRNDESLAYLFGEDGKQTWEGEKRHRLEETVQVSGSLKWHGSNLKVRLKGTPANRNFMLYLVVEEQLYGSGQWLHTHFAIPFNNQLTFVPDSFFKREAEAKAKAGSILADFNLRYREVVEVRPEDPIVHLTNPTILVEATALQRLVSAADVHRPDLLTQAIDAYDVSLETDFD